MKKRICILLTGVIMACSLVACGDGKKDESAANENVIQQDLLEFVNDELPGIATDKDKALSIYNSYFTGETMDNDAFVEDLKKNAIPSMERYIENLNAIEVDTAEVEEIKNLYLMASQKQYEAMKLVVSAIESELPDYLTQAEALIVEAQTYMKDYETKVVELAANNQITIKSDTISSGAVEEAPSTEAQ